MSFGKSLKLWQKSGLIFAGFHFCIFVLLGNTILIFFIEIPLFSFLRIFNYNIITDGYMFSLVGGTISYGIIGILFGSKCVSLIENIIIDFNTIKKSPLYALDKSREEESSIMKIKSPYAWWKLLFKIPVGWIVLYPFILALESAKSIFAQSIYFLVKLPCYQLDQIFLHYYKKLYGLPKVGVDSEYRVLLLSGILSYYLLALFIMILIRLKRKYERNNIDHRY